jgi:hypothetical protein
VESVHTTALGGGALVRTMRRWVFKEAPAAAPLVMKKS